MLSLIEVQCPHCGAKGQIMIPPVGSIIIGPCPQCKELVVVFCGQVLPLDKDTMQNGPVEERREHLLSVLTEFLQDRIEAMMTEQTQIPTGEELEGQVAPAEADGQQQAQEQASEPISQTEFERFTEVDLKLLDNEAYFKSVFEKQ